MKIRPTKLEDIENLEVVVEETELFPKEMLADMLSEHLSGDDSSSIWLTCELEDKAVGFCYAVPEQLTEGTWNMLAIAVKPEYQGDGCGKAIVAHLEKMLAESDQRLLIVDTSGQDQFARTRQFYLRNGYLEEARIRDYWAAGDDKIVFWKSLK